MSIQDAANSDIIGQSFHPISLEIQSASSLPVF